MWESRVLRRAFERLELHEGKLSRAVLRGGGGGDVTSLPDTWVGNHPGLPGPEFLCERLGRDSSSLLTGANMETSKDRSPGPVFGWLTAEDKTVARHEWGGMPFRAEDAIGY